MLAAGQYTSCVFGKPVPHAPQGTDRNACLLYSSLQLGSSDPIRWFTIRKCLLFFRLSLELQSALHAPFHPPDVSIDTFLAVPDGLWPNYAQGDGPTCCNNPDFDVAKVY